MLFVQNVIHCITSIAMLKNMKVKPIQKKKWFFIKYPNPPQKRQWKECDQELKKDIKTASGNAFFGFITIWFYCYRTVTGSLKTLYNSQRFEGGCGNW